MNDAKRLDTIFLAGALLGISVMLSGCASEPGGAPTGLGSPQNQYSSGGWLGKAEASGELTAQDVADLNYIRHEFERTQVGKNFRLELYPIPEFPNFYYPQVIFYSTLQKTDYYITFRIILVETITTSYVPGSAGYRDAWKISYWDYTDPINQEFTQDSNWSQESTERTADALRRLCTHFQARGIDADDKMIAEFAKEAEAWRALPSKPPMPEEARQHVVLSQNALNEKNVDRATNELMAALKIFPTWPEGWYNVALMAGELHIYGGAALDMRRYILLNPDGPDVQAAKDQILIWTDKTKHK